MDWSYIVESDLTQQIKKRYSLDPTKTDSDYIQQDWESVFGPKENWHLYLLNKFTKQH